MKQIYIFLMMVGLILSLGGCGGEGGDSYSSGPLKNTSATTEENHSVDINVAGNNDDIKNMDLWIHSEPNSGTATVLGNGLIRYTPGIDFVGEDSFIYGESDTNNYATVFIKVTAEAYKPPPTHPH